MHELLAVYDSEMRTHLPWSRVRVIEEPGLTYAVNDGPGVHGGWVMYMQPEAREDDQAIRCKMEFCRALGRAFGWTVFDHDAPADLKQRLGACGFEPEEPEALMALDLETAPAGTRSATTADVRAVTDPAWIDAAMDVQRAVWHENFGELAAELRHDLLSDPDRLSIYLAYVDGQPVSIGWIRFFEGSRFARLNGGCTLPAYRSRGRYSVLVSVWRRKQGCAGCVS